MSKLFAVPPWPETRRRLPRLVLGLVLCGVAGVQSQSMTVDRQMRRYRVPRLAFVNKCDRTGANPLRVKNQLREKLGHNPVLLQLPIGLEDKHEGVVDLITMEGVTFTGDNGEEIHRGPIPADMRAAAQEAREEMLDAVSMFSDELTEAILEDRVTPPLIRQAIRRGTLEMKLTPVLMGSAYKNRGVQLLLDAVTYYLPNPNDVENEAIDFDKEGQPKVKLSADPSKNAVALAFKLEDGRYGQLTYVRIYQGSVQKGDVIVNNSQGRRKVKVPRIVRMHSDEMHDVTDCRAGDIVAFFGVECASGDTFTTDKINYTMTSMHVPDAVIDLAVKPKKKEGEQNFSKALNRFTKEDPTFRVRRDEESAQTIISGMGELHLDIYIERIKREYGCEVEVGRPQVAYRETVQRRGEFNYTHKKQTGGRGQYAKVAGWIEPLPADAVESYEFVDEIVGGTIPREYIPACDKGFKEAVKEGSLIGFPVVGVRVTVNDGAAHAVDSSEQAFKTAALMGFREAYAVAKPVILEPIMKVEVTAPEEFQGSVMGQLNQRRGIIVGSSNAEGYLTATAEVPLSAMFGYSTDLRSATQGKGEFTMEFAKYSPVPKQEQDTLMKEYTDRRKGGAK